MCTTGEEENDDWWSLYKGGIKIFFKSFRILFGACGA